MYLNIMSRLQDIRSFLARERDAGRNIPKEWEDTLIDLRDFLKELGGSFATSQAIDREAGEA